MQKGNDYMEQIRHMHIAGALDGIQSHIRHAGELLKIEVPEIVVVPYQYDFMGQHKIVDVWYDEILLGDPSMGYFVPSAGIIISRFNPYEKVPVAEPELLASIIHELRHVWQYTYHRTEYYQNNTVGEATIKDPAEVDADAYAMVYMRNYTLYQPHTYDDRIGMSMALDGGARLNRIMQLESHMKR